MAIFENLNLFFCLCLLLFIFGNTSWQLDSYTVDTSVDTLSCESNGLWHLNGFLASAGCDNDSRFSIVLIGLTSFDFAEGMKYFPIETFLKVTSFFFVFFWITVTTSWKSDRLHFPWICFIVVILVLSTVFTDFRYMLFSSMIFPRKEVSRYLSVGAFSTFRSSYGTEIFLNNSWIAFFWPSISVRLKFECKFFIFLSIGQ